ncbi:MAG: periplasmic heavy metal sensor [Xanthobacteraceae bacterium]
MSVSPQISRFGTMRWLLPVSLTLNLAFAGAAGASFLRHSAASVPLEPVTHMTRGAEQRLDRIATSLPAPDAQIMRSAIRAEAAKVVAAQASLRLSQEDVRNSLRAEPFDPAAVRAAMAETSAARDNYDQVLHDLIASAAARMSPVGRSKLADWPPPRPQHQNAVITQ